MDVLVFAGSLRGDEPPEQAGLTTVHVRPLLPRAGFSGLFSLRAARSLVRHTRDADVVHISIARDLFPLYALALALLFRKPVVAQPHGMLTTEHRRVSHKVVDILLRRMVRRCNAIIALTTVEHTQLRAWLNAGNAAIYEIGNPSPFSGVPTSELYTPKATDALFAARLHPRKRADVFVAAAKRSWELGWQNTYRVLGPDQGHGVLVAEAAVTLPNLSYDGAVPAEHVGLALAKAKAFVLPSADEPWGNVLASAIRLGVPVIVSESAALATEIRQHHLGIVVPDGDSDAIADAVQRISNRSWRSKSDENSAKIYRHARFGEDSIARQLRGAYRAVTQNGGRSKSGGGPE